MKIKLIWSQMIGCFKEDVIEMGRMSGADVGFDLPTDDAETETYSPALYLGDKSSNFTAGLKMKTLISNRTIRCSVTKSRCT